MNNLRRFSTEAEYQQASLNYPAVSWITATDNVHFDKTAPTPTVNDKVMMAWTSGDGAQGTDIVLWNGGLFIPPTDLFNSLTVNDVDVMSDLSGDATLYNYSEPNTDYLVKYELIDDSTITDIFNAELGGGWGSSVGKVDFLIPSQVTEIESLPENVGNVVVEAATPPTQSFDWSSMHDVVFYVPDNAVSVYQTAWGGYATIRPISEYQGNLPV